MLTNAAITIFNKFPNRKTKKFVFVPHYLPAVWFYTKQKSTVGENGLRSADEYQIRIPYSACEEWLPENYFQELDVPGEKWTVQKGDFFIVGEWNGDAVNGIEEIKQKFSGTVGKILSHS